jgi:hypothetical protein
LNKWQPQGDNCTIRIINKFVTLRTYKEKDQYCGTIGTITIRPFNTIEEAQQTVEDEAKKFLQDVINKL